MSYLRYSRSLKPIRRFLSNILLLPLYHIVKLRYTLPTVLTIDETLDKIVEGNKSVSRFGDGELVYITDKINLPFQSYEPGLASKLKTILKSTEDEVLVCLPEGYRSFDEITESNKKFWKKQISWVYPRVEKYLDINKIYYNANITRWYHNIKDKDKCDKYIQKLMRIWSEREVLLVEGEKSRLGVANDLFAKARNVERILGPMHHAFSKYNELYEEVLKHDKKKLVLVALGPTATALVYDLALQGYQAIDIGNVDLEYEWYIRRTTTRIKIPGKYTSEVVGGRDVEDINDASYHSQITARIL